MSSVRSSASGRTVQPSGHTWAGLPPPSRGSGFWRTMRTPVKEAPSGMMAFSNEALPAKVAPSKLASLEKVAPRNQALLEKVALENDASPTKVASEKVA